MSLILGAAQSSNNLTLFDGGGSSPRLATINTPGGPVTIRYAITQSKAGTFRSLTFRSQTKHVIVDLNDYPDVTAFMHVDSGTSVGDLSKGLALYAAKLRTVWVAPIVDEATSLKTIPAAGAPVFVYGAMAEMIGISGTPIVALSHKARLLTLTFGLLRLFLFGALLELVMEHSRRS